MPKTRKKLLPKNLAKYDVYIEDTSVVSPYFQVTNLPPSFGGGKNSFLIGGSSLLKPGSLVQIEILDARGFPIFQNPVQKYIQGNSRLVSVEINESTAPGFATIILMGQTIIGANGEQIPPNWQNSYNVRWTKSILVEPNVRTSSPIILKNTPSIFLEETRLYNISTSSYSSSSVEFTASLTPTLFSGYQVGYLIKTEAPTTFSADYNNLHITGSLIIDDTNANVYVPLTDILNQTTGFSSGYLIKAANKKIVDKIYLYSGSYITNVFNTPSTVTSSIKLVYDRLTTDNVNIPLSYAKIRVVNMNTVSGEIYKAKVYNKVQTNISDYKLIADVFTTTSELLVTGSIRGDLPIGNINIAKNYTDNWYTGKLLQNPDTSQVLYLSSGSPLYYQSYLNNSEYIPSFTTIYNGGVITGSDSRTFIKTDSGSATDGWNGQVYSIEGYSQSLYVSAKATSTTQSVMFGLSTNPTLNATTSSIDYAWYLLNSGDLEIYKTGSYVTSSGTYTTESILSIVYENDTVKYLKNNIPEYTESRAVSGGLYFDSSFFYTSSQGITNVKFGEVVGNFTILSNNDTLLSSIYADVPIDFSTNKFYGGVSSSGYFIGNINSVVLFPSTEYTLQFDAVYKKFSGSVALDGVVPKVDIYIIGIEDTKIIDNNPLGQKIGTLNIKTDTENSWFQDEQFNFIPAIAQAGKTAVRFVISNGFWYFSEISLKPSSDKLFAPDEIQILVPNTDYHNEFLQYKIEFFDINNNSTEVSVISNPVFFTGSNIDLGVVR